MVNQNIIDCLTWYANRIAETVQYTNWSDEFARKEVKESTDKFLDEIKKYIDWDNLTPGLCDDLRFGKWTEGSNLWLIPLYLLPIVPIGTELISINGGTVKYDGTNVDNDIRFGCIAYGIIVK